MADCGYAALERTRVSPVCIRVETFIFVGKLVVRVCALLPISVQ